MPRRELELRCFCKSNPLLATYGRDQQGQLFVHIKVYKGERIYHESVIMGGTVKIRCRNCRRWHRIRIVGQRADLAPTQVPETLPRASSDGVLDPSDT